MPHTVRTGPAIFAALLLFAGCNGSPPPAGEPAAVSTQQSQSQPQIVKPAITPGGAIDPRAVAALSKSAIDDDARAKIARSPVPVLAPTNVTLENPTFIVEGEYYALSGRVHGATIAIQGTRAQHRYENIEA